MKPVKKRPTPHNAQGAALLTAMLTVALVATFAASAMWRQWRGVEVEMAERARVQSGWLLAGALDWTRMILREDARADRRSGGVDHLAEPWAVPLQEARLSTFLAADPSTTDNMADSGDTDNVFLSGSITDLQSRLNIANLVDSNGKPQPDVLAQFARLFNLLGLPQSELDLLLQQLERAQAPGNTDADAPLMPQKEEQLDWFGLAPATVAALQPYATLLPNKSLVAKVNLNTASAEVLQASAEGLDRAGAQKLLAARQTSYFKSLNDANKIVGGDTAVFTDALHSVSSHYFEARGRLRMDSMAVEERSVVQRDGDSVKTLWRERGAFAPTPTDAPPR